MGRRHTVHFRAIFNCKLKGKYTLIFEKADSCYDYKKHNANSAWLTLIRVYSDGVEEVCYDGL